MTKEVPLNTGHQARLETLKAQGRLLKRVPSTDYRLTPEDIRDLEIILADSLDNQGYTINEIENLRIRDGRIYGRVNVRSRTINDNGSLRHHTASIDFHTDYAFSIVFDNHIIGGDEWKTELNNTAIKLTYDDKLQRVYLNETEIYSVRASNTHLLLKRIFEQPGALKEITRIEDMFGARYTEKHYTINTKSIANNIRKKSGLKEHGLGFMISSFDYDWGLRVIAELTEADLLRHKISKNDIDNWLSNIPSAD